jgi:hypothetical protein
MVHTIADQFSKSEQDMIGALSMKKEKVPSPVGLEL